MKPFLQLKSVDEVLGFIDQAPPLAGEWVSLETACDRRIFSSFYAPDDLPGYIRSSMDGYAVIAADVFGASESSPALLRVAKNCPVGTKPDFTLAVGEASPIVTGAALPAGADTVIKVEDTRPAGIEEVEIIRSEAPGANLVEADEDAKQGQLLIPSGRQLRPQECGILAAYGVQNVQVFKRPKVAIISTGDEIVPINTVPAPCKMRDVNSWSLACFCHLQGALPEKIGIIPDNRDLLAQKLQEALQDAELVIVSGGSSAGMRDFTIAAFQSLQDSAIIAHGVSMRPGKPFILAKSGCKYLLGLPGHVTGALVCAHVFLAPLLARLQGQTERRPKPWLPAIFGRSYFSAQGRRDYIRCRLERAQDAYIAHPILNPSAVLSSLIAADGLVICPENSEGIAKGQEVKFYPLP